MWFVNILKSKMVGSCVRICWPSLRQKNYTRSKHRLVQQFYFSSTVFQRPGWPVSTYHSTDYDWLCGDGVTPTHLHSSADQSPWSILLITTQSTLQQHLGWHLRTTLHWHLVWQSTKFYWCTWVSRHSADYWLILDQVLIECWPSIYHNGIYIEMLMCGGYQSKVLIDTPCTYV